MISWLDRLSPAVTAALLAVAMIAGWALAWRWSKSLPEGATGTPGTKFADALLALLGLLLAFTFSMSLVKHENRRSMAIVDANAIGDFYNCVCLLPESPREELRSLLTQYVEKRLEVASSQNTNTTFEKRLAELQSMQGRMVELVKQAVDVGTPVTVPLVNTLNALTSSHTARVAAIRDRLPHSVVFLLCLAGVLSMTALGKIQGTSRELPAGVLAAFVALVCMVVWVILDLNDPQQGLITVSQEPLRMLLQSMEP